MQWTIKKRLATLTISGLVFVAAVSVTGYWGITSVEHATTQVSATSMAIRSHIEAGILNDMTWADISAIFAKKGQEQQDNVDNLALHSKMLAQGIAKARESATDPAIQSALDEEGRLVQQYLNAASALSKDMVRDPSKVDSGACYQLYQGVQQKIEDSSDQLEQSGKQAVINAISKAKRATRAMFAMCGFSLLLLLVVGTWVAFSITRPLDSFSSKFKAMAEANDLTARVDEERHDEIGQLGKCLNLFVEKVHDLLTQIASSAQHVSSASEELSATSQQITANSEETSAQADVVSNATQKVSQNLQTVATGAEEMGVSIKDIAKNATEAAKVATSAVKVATSAVKVAETATATVSKLGDSSTEIGQVIKVITSIAQQTNLLALNATIEAARAGEAGKGFAVVANEVKELAKETAKATEDISNKIEAIQSDTKAAVDAIASISGIINQINDISSTIATAVEEQNATTNEMSRNVAEAAQGSGEITSNIAGVAEAAQSTSRGSADTQKAAQELVQMSAQLRGLVAQFNLGATDDETGATPDEPALSRVAHAGA